MDTINYLNKFEAEELMNTLGEAGEDFFFLLNYRLDKCLICKPDEAEGLGIYYNFNGLTNHTVLRKKASVNLTQPKFTAPTFEEYVIAFDKVMAEIKAGNTYLINLCFRSSLDQTIRLENIMNYASSKYKIYFKDKFVSFSPETFIEISNRKIYTYPMKGTISANMPNSGKILINDPKELAEHYTIVDLLRNDLSISAKNVRVEKFRYLSKIKSGSRSLFQTSSQISGELPENYPEQLGSILFRMLPAGSITGAPKKKTIEILDQVETFERGFYTGIAGIYQSGKLDSCVLIRYIEKEGNTYFYKSGGGITFLSRPEDEYEELIEKIYVPFT